METRMENMGTKETLEFKGSYGPTYTHCYIETGKYTQGPMRYIQLLNSIDGPIAMITINILDFVTMVKNHDDKGAFNFDTDIAVKVYEDRAYLDWVIKNLDGKVIFKWLTGYVEVPIVRINLEKLNAMTLTAQVAEKRKRGE